MKEQWKAIPSYEGVYEVSNLGRVRALTRAIECNNQYGPCTRIVAGRILRPLVNSSGHHQVKLLCKPLATQQLVHRLVAQAFIPNPKNYPCVLHKDDDTSNNCKSNLRWGTQLDNIADMVMKGRNTKGRLACLSTSTRVLTDKKVDKMRKLRHKGVVLRVIAELFDVSISTVHEVCTGKTWSSYPEAV